MVRGYGPSPGHDTWCGPGTTPMIAQSPVDSPGMPGNGSSLAPAVVPGPTLAPIVGQGLSSPPPTSPRESGAASRAGACDSPASSRRTSAPAPSSSS